MANRVLLSLVNIDLKQSFVRTKITQVNIIILSSLFSITIVSVLDLVLELQILKQLMQKSKFQKQ